MRLVNADLLKDAMIGACRTFESNGIDMMIARVVISIIDTFAPGGEDTVCVVRCRECKYSYAYDDGAGRICYLCECEGHDGMSVSDNWYCADGERKDEQ